MYDAYRQRSCDRSLQKAWHSLSQCNRGNGFDVSSLTEHACGRVRPVKPNGHT